MPLFPSGTAFSLRSEAKGGNQGTSIVCPDCGADARFVEYRDGNVTTLLGQMVYERAYDHCDHCRCGLFPTDVEFGIEQKKTAGAHELMALAGVLEPFAEGAVDVLPRRSGLNVSASTVEDVTKAVGDAVAQMRASGAPIGPDEVWNWNVDATDHTVGYVSLDATGVPQQGPHGEQAEGRMPWVAAVFNPQPTHEEHRRRRIWESRSVSGLMSLKEIGAQLRRECQPGGARGPSQPDRLPAKQPAPHGRSPLDRLRLADRLGKDRVGLQDGGRPAIEAQRHALENLWHPALRQLRALYKSPTLWQHYWKHTAVT